MGKLVAGMTVRIVGTSDVGSLVLVREAAQTCVIKLLRDGALRKNVPLDDVREEKAAADDAQGKSSPIRLAASDKPLALPPSMGGPSPAKRPVSGSASGSASGARLELGDRVRARYKKGAKWFDGKIARVRSDGTYDVEYDDGDVETKVEDAHIERVETGRPTSPAKTLSALSPVGAKAKRFGVGESVKARYKKGTKLFAGKITKAHSDGSYDIRYEDGDVETKVDASYIQSDRDAEETTTPREASPKKKIRAQIGDKVKARYRKGAKLYGGVITRVHSDGTHDIKYEDGDTESRVEAKYIEFPETTQSDAEEHDTHSKKSTRKGFRVGDEVRAKYKGGKKLYPGIIKRVHSDGTYDIKYEDGDVETRVEADMIEDSAEASVSAKSSSPKKTSSPSFSVGDSIKARYKGGAKLFPGKIQKVRSDGTYDVKYEDGDMETGVDARHIELEEPLSARSTESELEVGDRVKARYKKGTKLFPGKITKAHADGSYDIRYDDGDTETRVKRDLIESDSKAASPAKTSAKRDDQLRVGDAVKARYKKGAKYFAGKITKVRTDGTFDIEYEDGDVEMRVEAAHIQATARSEADKASSPKKKRGYEVGDAVMARYKKGAKLYRGTVKRVRTDGTYDIKYEDGDVETAVELEYIESDSTTTKDRHEDRSTAFEVGEAVKAQYKNSSKWYPGRIGRARTDGTYDIDYDDGEKESRVDASRIERVSRQSSPGKKQRELQVGDHVKARYKGGKKLYEAVISRIRTDGTYDVKYEDGDTESRVPRDMIESASSSDATKSKEARELRVGDSVIATHKAGKKLYRGKITRVRANGTCDIQYQDGTDEDRVPMDKVKLDDDNDAAARKGNQSDDDESLSIGDVIQAYYKKGKKLFSGKITRRHSDDTYDIRYDDGDVENRVPRNLIVSDSKKGASKSGRSPKLGEGDLVMCKHKRSSKKVRGRISRARTDGTFDIEFDDGETATRVEVDMIELLDRPEEDEDRRRGKGNKGFEVGDNIKARYKKGAKWFPGRVTRARTDGTYDIKYEDGDVELSVAPDLIESIESKPDKAELQIGDEVSARYKNGSKWYNGVVKKVRTDGTFDIRYEDGDLEERVKPENVRANSSSEKTPRDAEDPRRSPSKKAPKYEKGDTVEADYKDRGRYQRGKISRVHSDGTYDIEYDNGDNEKHVSARSVRAVKDEYDETPTRKGKKVDSDSDNGSSQRRRRRSRSRSPSASPDSDRRSRKKTPKISKGSRVTMRKALNEKARRIGRVKKTHSDGTCDIQYQNGDVLNRISFDTLLVCSDAESSEEDRPTEKVNHRFRREQVVLACWKRSNRMAKPAMTDRWEEATIISTGDKRTYSIRYRDGDMEEDVPEEAIKPRSEPVVGRKAQDERTDSRSLSDADEVFLLEQLAMTLYEEGELKKKPRIRNNHDGSSSSSGTESDASGRSDASSPKAKKQSKRPRDPISKALNSLFDKKCLQRYQDRFDHHDKEESGRIPKSKIIEIVEELCSTSSSASGDDTTVRRQLIEWFSTQDALRTHSKFPFNTLMIAFAIAKNHLSKLKIQQNMANALEARFASHHESKKQLEMWQQKLGFRTFETLQRFFHDCAIPRTYPAQVRVSELASIFDQVTRSAVPNKPLEVYLKQMQLLPHHALQLPEFMCCYYQLYGSADTSRVPAWTEQLELRPVAFVASCLFSNGDPCCQRHGDLVRRLCIGRTPTQVDLIMRFREVFESLQGTSEGDSDATISTTHLNVFASKVVGDPSVLDQSVLALRKRTAAVSLVEIFSTCGFVIDELTSAPTVRNAIEKMRMRTESAEVRRIIGLVRSMCLKVLRFPNNPDYWRVRSDSAAFHQKLGRYDGATSLIESVGFIEYGKSHFELRGARTPDGKRSSCLPKSTLDILREKCSELDAELSVMDGVESVVSILQRIAKQRELDTPLSLEECEEVLKHLVIYVETVLKNPKDSRCWRIRESNKTFQRQIGYLPFCADLMASVGYDLTPSSQGNVYILRGTGLGRVGAETDKAKAAAVDASLSNFAFSSISEQMEWFLWRRKQEIQSLLQDDMEYLVQMLAPSTSAPTRQSQELRSSRLVHTSKTPGKMYPYGRNALDTFNKTATQKAQLTMMQSVFESLDTKKRGYLLAEDLRRDQKVVPRWAAFEAFDLDKDDRVDFTDFVGALGPGLDHSFDPTSVSDFVPFQRMSLSEQVSTLVGRLRLAVGLAESISVVDTMIGFLMRIIDQPGSIEVRSIQATAAIVSQSKRVQAVKALLELAGYRAPAQSTNASTSDSLSKIAFVLQPHQQVRFQTSKSSLEEAMPLDSQTLSRLQLISAMLGGHARLMLFPSISDIGAVARGVGELRPFQVWTKLLELVGMCLENILKHPEDEDRYRQLKTTTSTFSSVVSNVSGGVQLFLAIGFRETDHGTLLLPDSISHGDIKARKLEMNVGCQVLKITEKLSSSSSAEEEFPLPPSPRKSTGSGGTASSDPAVDYYKRKALAAELAREEALQKSAHLEKQLEIVAKTQSRRSLTKAPLTPSSRTRGAAQPKPQGANQHSKSLTTSSHRGLAVVTTRSTDRSQSIEAEILADFSPRKSAVDRQEKTASNSPLRQTRAQSARGGRTSQQLHGNSAKPVKSIQRRNPSTPSSTIRAQHSLATLHESSLAMDSDAGSNSIVLRSSNAYLQKGALVRVSTENRDLTEERLIVNVDTGTFPNLTKVLLHSPLLFPHFVRDLVFILPPIAVDSGDRLSTASVEAFIRDQVLDVIFESVVSAPRVLAIAPESHSGSLDMKSSRSSTLMLAHTLETTHRPTISGGGVCGEQLVLSTIPVTVAKGSLAGLSDEVSIVRDDVTLHKLRAVWEGLLLEFGGSSADQILWRHLHAVLRRIPWISVHKPTILTKPQMDRPASWRDFVEWLQFPLSMANGGNQREEANETPEQLLALTVLRQHFRALISDSLDDNSVFHSVPADELMKRSSASLITVSAAPTEARDIVSVQTLFTQLDNMFRAQNRRTVVWPEIDLFIRHGQILHHAEIFPSATTLRRSLPDNPGHHKIAAVLCASTSDAVFLLRMDGHVETWKWTSAGASERVSTSLALFYASSTTRSKHPSASKSQSLVEDYMGTVAHGMRDPEWWERHRQRVCSAVDGFIRSTSTRRTLLSLTAHDAFLVVNASMLSEADRPLGGGLLYFHVSTACDASLRPLRRLYIENTTVNLKMSEASGHRTASQVVSSSGVIEAFTVSADGAMVFFQNTGKACGLLWIASSVSGRIISYVDEFAWLPNSALLFTTMPGSVVCVASTKASYVSVIKISADGEQSVLRCVLPPPQDKTAATANVSTIVATDATVFAALENGKIAVWITPPSSWGSHGQRVPATLIQQAATSVHQLTLFSPGYRERFREALASSMSSLVVPHDEDALLRSWDENLPNRSVRLALYLLENGDVVDVAVPNAFSSLMVTLDVAACVERQSELLSTPGFDRVLLQPEAVVRAVLLACEYRRDGVFAQKSMRELLDDIKSKRVLFMTRREMDKFVKAYDESVGLFMRCYYREKDSPTCAITTPTMTRQLQHDVSVMVAAVGEIGGRSKERSVLQFWHFSPRDMTQGGRVSTDDASQRLAWEFEAYRIRRQRVLETIQTQRHRIVTHRQSVQHRLQTLIAKVFENGSDSSVKERIAEGMLENLELLCWLGALEFRSTNDPVELGISSVFGDKNRSMLAKDFDTALRECERGCVTFRPWSQRLRAALPLERDADVTLDEMLLRVRQWRRESLSIESLCGLIHALGVLSHVIKRQTSRSQDSECDATTRTIITQHFSAFALSRRSTDAEKSSHDVDGDYHTLLTFISPRVAAEFILRSCDVGDRLGRCVDVIADRTVGDKHQARQQVNTTNQEDSPLNPEEKYAQLLLRKRLREKVERIEQRQNRIHESPNNDALERAVSASATQHYRRILKTALPSVAPSVSSITVCIPAVVRRMSKAFAVDAEGNSSNGKIGLTIVICDEESQTPEGTRRFQQQSAFYRRVQQWKTRDLFLPIIPSASDLPVLRSEHLPGPDTSRVLVCESLTGWFTLRDCIHSLCEVTLSWSMVHWQSMIAFWSRQILLGLAVLEEDGLRVASLSLADLIVSPDGKQIRFGALQLRSKPTGTDGTEGSDGVELCGELIVQMCQAFAGGVTETDSRCERAQRVLSFWCQWDESVGSISPTELLERFHDGTASSESDLTRVMAAAYLALQPRASFFHPTASNLLWCLAFADVDEEPPASLATKLSWVISIHTQVDTSVLCPLRYINGQDDADPLIAAKMLQESVHDLSVALLRVMDLSTLGGSWSNEVKRSLLMWIDQEKVIERLILSSISLFEKCLQASQREAASALIREVLEMLRSTLDRVEATETLSALLNEPVTQQLVFTAVRALCVMCGTPAPNQPLHRPSPAISAALWRMSEAYLREVIGVSTHSNQQDSRNPKVLQFLQALRASLDDSLQIQTDVATQKSSQSLSTHLALWWRQPREGQLPGALPQRHPSRAVAGAQDADMVLDELVLLYHTLELRFNASSAATASAPKFRLSALQAWLSPQFLDRKTAFPLVFAHDLTARVWLRLDMATTLCELLRDADDRIVFGTMSLLDVYTRVLRYRPLRHETRQQTSSSMERHQFCATSPALQLARNLVENPLVTNHVTHILTRLVRALKVMGESAASAAISSRYGASGMRASDPVGLFCVTVAFLVNCMHGGNVATRHWISSGLMALILSHAKAKSLLFIKIVDSNWIHQSAPAGPARQRSGSRTTNSTLWSVFSDLPLTHAVQKVSPFELLVRELTIFAASGNTLLLQHLRTTSATIRQMVESFGSSASASAHLILSADFGKLSQAREVVRDVDEYDGTLEEKAQAIEYATTALVVWLSTRLRASPLPLVVEKLCETVWAWLVASWRHVLSSDRTHSKTPPADETNRHHAVVSGGLGMIYAIATNRGITIAELKRLVASEDDPCESKAGPPSESTVLASVLSLLRQTGEREQPSVSLSVLFRSGMECILALVGGIRNSDQEQRTLSILKHGFLVSGLVKILRMDTMALAQCCSDGRGASVRYATQLKTRIWAALLHHGDRDVARAIVDEELMDYWLVQQFDNDISLQNRDDDDDNTLEDEDHAGGVVNGRIEVLAQLEVLLHACYSLDYRSSLAVHLLVGDFIKSVLVHRTLHQEKQRVLTYAQFLRTCRGRHSPLVSLAARMVATAKRFVQLVCCLCVDSTTGDSDSAVLASLGAAGVPRDIVAWHQHSEPVAGADTRESRRVSEFWEAWPEASATLEASRRPVEERDIAVLTRTPPIPRPTKLVSPTRIWNENLPSEPLPPKQLKPRDLETKPKAKPAEAIPLDELLVCLDSDVTELESVFQRHATTLAGNQTSREKFMAPHRLAVALRECHVAPTETTLPPLTSLAQLPFSGFLLEYARRSGLEALWRKVRGQDVVYVRLMPSGRWTNLPKAHWMSVQQLTANERSLSTSRLVEILLSLHRGLFSRHELTALVAKTLPRLNTKATEADSVTQQQLRRVVAVVYDEASTRPAVKKLLLQPSSPQRAGTVPVSPVRVPEAALPQRTATLSPRRGADAEGGLGAMRESVVQTLVSIDVDSARALHRHSQEERLQRRKKTRGPNRGRGEEGGGGGGGGPGSVEDSLGSDAYSPFSESSSTESERGTRQRSSTSRRKPAAEKKQKKKRTAEAKSRGGEEKEEEKKAQRSDSERSDQGHSSSSSSRRTSRRTERRSRRRSGSSSSSGSSSPAPRRRPRPSGDLRPGHTTQVRPPVRHATSRTTLEEEDAATATLRQVFAKYDADGDGAIGFADLRRVVGPKASGAELQRWIAEKDRRGVGAVDFSDFVFAFSSKAV